jgi:vitamin K-dependent gamma-carboxylase
VKTGLPKRQATTVFDRVSSLLNEPVNIGSLVIFRMMFGILLAIEMFRYVLLNRVERVFPPDGMQFSYFGLSWLEPLSWPGMQIVFLVAGAAALAIACGYHFRFACIVFTSSLGYIFLLDKSAYTNHLYLSLLLSVLLTFMPAHAACSYDAKHRPIITSDTAPAYCLWLLRIQFAIVFLYSSIARLDPDWILALGSAPSWLASSLDSLSSIGIHVSNRYQIYAIYWALVLNDFLIFLGLIYRPLRLFTVSLICATYITKALFFDLGIAPWLMISSSLLFLRPDWPHRFRRLWPAFDERLLPKMLRQEHRGFKIFVLCGMATYLCLQIIIPIRHLSYPAELDWSREASRFSWGIKERNQEVDIKFSVEIAGQEERTPINLAQYLSKHQIRALNTWPDLVADFAQQLRMTLERQGKEVTGVYALAVRKDLEGNRQLLLNPNTNLLELKLSRFLKIPWEKQISNNSWESPSF